MLEVKNGLDISRLKVQVYALTDLGDSLEKSLFSQLGRAVQWLPIVLWAPAGTINVDVLRVEAERVGLHHVCHLPIQHTNSCEKKITHKVRRLGYQTYLVTYQTRLPKVNVLEKVWQSDRWRRDSERMISGFRRWRGDKTWGYKKKKPSMRRQEEKNVVTVRLKEIGQTANSHFLLPQSNPRQTQTEKTVETKDFTEKSKDFRVPVLMSKHTKRHPRMLLRLILHRFAVA